MMENLVPVFIAVTAAAVVLQAGILVALYVGVRKTTAKLEATVEDLKGKAAPTIESAHSMLTELRPKVGQIVDTMVELRPRSVRLWTRRSSCVPRFKPYSII